MHSSRRYIFHLKHLIEYFPPSRKLVIKSHMHQIFRHDRTSVRILLHFRSNIDIPINYPAPNIKLLELIICKSLTVRFSFRRKTLGIVRFIIEIIERYLGAYPCLLFVPSIKLICRMIIMYRVSLGVDALRDNPL